MAVERRVDALMIGEVHALTPEDVACVIRAGRIQTVRSIVVAVVAWTASCSLRFLLEQAEKNGARVIREKVALEAVDEEVRVCLGGEVHVFDAVVLSSGAWVKELLEPLEYYVDVRPQKGSWLNSP